MCILKINDMNRTRILSIRIVNIRTNRENEFNENDNITDYSRNDFFA